MIKSVMSVTGTLKFSEKLPLFVAYQQTFSLSYSCHPDSCVGLGARIVLSTNQLYRIYFIPVLYDVS